MKTSHDNSLLENFLRDSLKNLDVQYQQSDWSDMESLLGPVQKPVELNVSRKTILISASVLAIIIIGIIISKTVHFNNSSPEEISPQNTNSSQSLLNAADTQKTTVLTPVIDSAKPAPVLIEKNKIDSVKTVASPDTNKNSAAKIIPKQDKKQKQNAAKIPPADTSSMKTPVELPAVDTTSKHPLQETTPLAPAETSKKSKKDKKSKLKFLFRQKPDSLR